QKSEGMVGHSLPNARIIYTAVNALFLEQPPKTDYSIGETIHLVSVGRIDWRKGLEHGLMAVRALVQRGYNVHWHIIGDGEYRDPVEWAILDMGMTNYVTLEGPKDQQAIHQFLRDADIYFHPAVHEGLSNAIVEAMATAVPVVACDVCGNGEAVLVGQTGLLAPARDWKMMADQLEQLIKDEALRQRLGQ